MSDPTPTPDRPPLEDFLRRSVEAAGGSWDEVEPQVYDLLLTDDGPQILAGSTVDDIVRITFDPEALPEHPGSQLASHGTPLVDRLLANAIERGRTARLYTVGLNLSPRDIEARVRRAFTVSPGFEFRVLRARALDFPQAVFWFQATLVSDQEDREIFPVAIDLHQGRQVRHLEKLIDPSRLAAQPCPPLPEVRRQSAGNAYFSARERVLRTCAAIANTRNRELRERLERQVTRMRTYYSDLRGEIEDQSKRAAARGDDLQKVKARRNAVDREELLRVAELEKKSALRVQLRLLNLLVVHQPKVLVSVAVVGSAGGASSASSAGGTKNPIDIVWDPLVESMEAVDCPACSRPVFAFGLDRQSRAVCPDCASKLPVVPERLRVR